MHPLALWLINATQFRERDVDDRLLRRQRDARGQEEELTPLARDGRWAAIMHRWAEAERAEEQVRALKKRVDRDRAVPSTVTDTAAMPTATLGCATA